MYNFLSFPSDFDEIFSVMLVSFYSVQIISFWGWSAPFIDLFRELILNEFHGPPVIVQEERVVGANAGKNRKREREKGKEEREREMMYIEYIIIF